MINVNIPDDELPQGWVVSPQLLDEVFFITTKIFSNCPAGIYGGYPGAEDSDKDESFSVECHSDHSR